jgi:CRISPR-associated endonuclease/helicase Cas3
VSIGERFADFFAAVNDGQRPYPWQRALVEQIARSGRWPDIAAPTGSGKSSVIDAHVFLVAEHAAGRLATRPPRRLVLVAPRRVLVDDQYDRATVLARVLSGAAARKEDGSLDAEVAGALLGLVTSSPTEGEAAPLAAWRLRGGVQLEDGWRLEPAACQVICATPQMWGSRLLLRGYGASRASRNHEAGMLGQDAVVVIDEAHLHERLVETARNVAARSPTTMGLQVVAMSATRSPAASQAGLGAEDLQDGRLARRVQAVKRVEVVEVDDWRNDGTKAVVEHARMAAGQGTVGVFVNDVPMALDVAAALSDRGGQKVELVCGRLRRADVSRLRARRPGLLTAAGNDDVDFLVSTQSLEVGVDLDLPAMVSTIASASALAQRAGRLNRSGRLASSTFVVVSPEGLLCTAGADGLPRSIGPYEQEELIAAARWLDGLGGSISPEEVAASTLPLPDRPPLPALRGVDLETLAMTSDVLGADPDVALYLDDPERVLPEVGIAARRHLELDAGVVRGVLMACPPRSHEVATVRLGKTLERIVGAVDHGEVASWVVRTRDGQTEPMKLADALPLGSGDTLVVPDGARICTAGVVGLREGPGVGGALDDVLSEVSDGERSDHIVAVPAENVHPLVEQDPALGGRASRTALADVLEDIRPDLARRLRHHRRLTDLELHWCGGDSRTGVMVVRELERRAEQTPLVTAEAVTVDGHQAAVERRMGEILHALAPEGLGADCSQLELAAYTHDEGKRHPRFQRRMGATGVELAKPRPGHRPDRGDGWRHEQLSAGYAAHASGGDPLVITLVAAHHGRGRPIFDRGAGDLLDGWSECPDEVRVWADRLFGPSGSYEDERARVEQRLGVHRLALLEALLRCADIQVSREGG